jgi:nicotinamidase-related amidase
MRILKDETIAVVIDIQEKLFPHIYENEQLAANCSKLLSGLQELEIPILVTEQYTAGLGITIKPVRELISKSYYPIEKLDFSCCGSVDFLGKLNDSGKKSVILLGIETHVCVLQTALDLITHRFIPVIVEDCVSSRKTVDKAVAIERLRGEGCIITTYESILLELCKVAGTDQFRAVSKIIR